MDVEDMKSRQGVLLRSSVSLAGMVSVLGLLMFLPAGISWWRGWLFLMAFCVAMVLSAAYLWRVNPEIFIARSRVHAGTKPWDKVLLVLIVASFFAISPAAGFDARYGWSSVPTWLCGVGYALFALGFVLSTWVYAVNKFAEPSVRIQADRGQRVIDGGPYAIIRHPLYSASSFLVVGMAFAMGSYWALVPVGFGAVVIIIRTVLEDSMLQRELAGYADYASRVRYRLIPGLW